MQQFPGLSTTSYLTIGLPKLESLFQEAAKGTYEDGREGDTAEEKLRKLNEKNFN